MQNIQNKLPLWHNQTFLFGLIIMIHKPLAQCLVSALLSNIFPSCSNVIVDVVYIVNRYVSTLYEHKNYFHLNCNSPERPWMLAAGKSKLRRKHTFAMLLLIGVCIYINFSKEKGNKVGNTHIIRNFSQLHVQLTFADAYWDFAKLSNLTPFS